MMTITSLSFFTLFLISIGIYYLVPGKVQWITLLVFSVIFYCLSTTPFTGVFLILSIVLTWLSANQIAKFNVRNDQKHAKRALSTGIVLNLGILIVLKYGQFILRNVSGITSLFGLSIPFEQYHPLMSMGISFYTMQIIAYLIDVYWNVTDAEKSVARTALFVGYFPLLTSGPIVRHGEMEYQLYAERKFSWHNVTFGLQRMVWGVYKKLVVSAIAADIVNPIYSNMEAYSGLYIWIAAVVFMLELYADFSGCMDIVIGASECYGIELPENFSTPFFSRSVQEYWQRWHSTLGVWMRDYILYPSLRSKWMQKLAKWSKKHFGRKASRAITTHLGALIVWLLVGLWHGPDWKYILGMGLWFWGCITLGQLFDPLWEKWMPRLHLHTESKGWHAFQSLRVLLLVSIGNMFFHLNSIGEVFHALYLAITTWNPQILIDGSIFGRMISQGQSIVLFISLLLMVVVSRQGMRRDIRVRIAGQNIVVRYTIWIMLIAAIALFGAYGPEYNAASFIYQMF